MFAIGLLYPILGAYTEEYVNEGLPSKKSKDLNLKYLECSWSTDCFNNNKELIEFPNYMDFQGRSKYYRHFTNAQAIEMTSVDKLINIPIKIRNEIIVYDETKKTQKEARKIIGHKEPNLITVLYSIMTELMFCGSPKERDGLASRVDNIHKDAVKRLNEARKQGKKPSDIFPSASDIINEKLSRKTTE